MLEAKLIPAVEKSSRLMIMLHGLGDSMDGYGWWPEAMGFPWMNYLLVNAPDTYYEGFSWFDYPNDIAPGILRSRKLLFELLDEVRAQGFPAEQITLGGFSQGSLMTVDVGLRYPHRLAGLVGISGWVFELEKTLKELSPVAKQQRLLATHGLYDQTIACDPVRVQIETLKAAGLNVEWREYTKSHTFHMTAEVPAIREFVRAGYPVVGK